MKQTKRNMKISRRNKKRTFRKTRQRRIKGGDDYSLIEIIKKSKASKSPPTDAAIYNHIHDILKLSLSQVKGTKPIEEWQMGLMTEIDTDRKTLLHYACEFGLDDVVFTILDCDKDGIHVKINAQDKNGWTPLHYACVNGHLNVVQTLSEKGGLDFKVRNHIRNMPIHLAAYNGNVEIIKTILTHIEGNELGYLNTENNDKMIPLHYACNRGNTDAVKILLENGSSINAQDKFGKTPLHHACENGHDGVVDALLDSQYTLLGINVKLTDNAKKTPLHYAADKDYANIAEKLEDAGADIDARDKNGRTPLQLACEKDNPKVVEKLKSDPNYVCRRTVTEKIRKFGNSVKNVSNRLTQQHPEKHMRIGV